MDHDQTLEAMGEDQLRDCLRELVTAINQNDLEDAGDILEVWGLRED